jgi:hypothetical protein
MNEAISPHLLAAVVALGDRAVPQVSSRTLDALDVAFGRIYAVLAELDEEYAGDRDALMIVAAERAAVDQTVAYLVTLRAKK